jgi:hypothetical protein
MPDRMALIPRWRTASRQQISSRMSQTRYCARIYNQQIVDHTAARESVTVNPVVTAIIEKSSKAWVASGGELIDLPPDEQASLLKTLASVGEDASKTKALLHAAYRIVSETADRTRQAPNQ